MTPAHSFSVIPAQAGIQLIEIRQRSGTTCICLLRSIHSLLDSRLRGNDGILRDS
jgi:hypothetical protein